MSSKILVPSRILQGVRAGKGKTFSTSACRATVDIPTQHSQKYLAQGAKHGMVSSKPMYSSVYKKMQHCMNWKWARPDTFVYEMSTASRYHTTLAFVYSLLFMGSQYVYNGPTKTIRYNDLS